MDRVIVCRTCATGGEAPQGEAFAERLRALAPDGVAVETVACMNLCDRPLALALRGPGKAVYLFAGVDPERDLADALALIGLYRDAPGGEITDARPAGRLRTCLVGRVPG